MRVVKNKVAPPFRTTEFDILFDEGISRTGELLDLGLEAELVQKTGTWMSYGEERLGQGRENSRQTLKNNPELAARLEHQVREAMGLPVASAQPPPESGQEAEPAKRSGGRERKGAKAKGAAV